MHSERYIVYNGKKYAFDLKRIIDFCLISDKETGKESEVIENFELDENDDSPIPKLVAKTSRTLKGTGNPQNDTITYDLIKLFVTCLLADESPILPSDTEEIPLTIGVTLALNTMLESNFLYEI